MIAGTGISTPLAITILLVVVAIVFFFLPIFMKKKSLVDYSNFDWKNNNCFFNYGGVGGIGYSGLKLSKEPVVHQGGRADIWLEGIENPLTNVNINELDKDCDYKAKINATSLFGSKMDVYLKVDANGDHYNWDNMFVQDWSVYTNNLQKQAKAKVLATQLEEKEFEEELESSNQNVSMEYGGGALRESR